MVANVTGWNELLAGHIATSAYLSLDTALGGWLFFIIFVVVQGAIYLKTESMPLVTIMGVLMFGGFYGVQAVSGYDMFNATANTMLWTIMVLELAGTIYKLAFQN